MDIFARNNVRVSGGGDQTFVFAHGFGTDQSAWSDVAPAFAAKGRVILFDHVGAGGSDLSAYDFDRYASLQSYADDLNDIGAALDLKRAVFVGHSVSAMIGMLAAIRAPDQIGSLVMVCPSPRYLNDEDYFGGFTQTDIDDLLEVIDSNFLSWSRANAPRIMGNADRPELGEALVDSFCRSDPAIARAFARATFLSDHRADLPHLLARTLILQTREDMVAPIEVGAYMQGRLPNCDLLMMEATGHCPHMSAPDETIRAISDFVGQTSVRDVGA